MTMKTVFEIVKGIHILSVVGVLAILLVQVKKSPRTISGGVLHALWTALVAALFMVGTWTKVEDEELNHTKIGVKLLILAVILLLGYKNVKKPAVSTVVWASMIGLTTLNIALAYLWK